MVVGLVAVFGNHTANWRLTPFFAHTTGTQHQFSPTISCPLAETFVPSASVPVTFALPLAAMLTDNVW